jgi:dehydrogenase/reductase SDR family protein 12
MDELALLRMREQHETRAAVRRGFADTVDALLELSIAGSFSRLGYVVRRRLERWTDSGCLEGKTMIVTGASSGIGQATAISLAAQGAELWLVGRNAERLRAAGKAAEMVSREGRIHTAVVDIVDAEAAAAFAAKVSSLHDELAALVHNAGALFPDYGLADDGAGIQAERTVATHVLAPFRLSCLLAPLLLEAERPVITTVTSGGMYTQRFDPQHIEAGPDGYRGAVAYGRAKRAQVVLSHEWARRWCRHGLASYAVHPGWVATPGLVQGLPTFAKLGPLLRTPPQGADTVAWLASDGPRRAGQSTQVDGLWHDRRRRGEYYLPSTRRTSSESERDGRALWDWCAERSGLGR